MTDTIDIGALTYPEGYFLLPDRAVQRRPYVSEEFGTDRAYRHVFSYAGSRPEIKEAALELLASARRKVFLASFRVGEPDLLEALYDAAARLRGGVYVVSALDQRTLRKGLEVEAADDPDSADVRAQNKRFEDLTSRGIAVRGHENCHAKFLVVDDRVALVSSANLETTALVDGSDRGATGENGAVVSDPEEVARLSRFFTRLWYACPFEMPPGESHTVQTRTPVPSPCRVPVPPVGSTAGVIWTHDDDERGILDTIHDIIERARERLLLTTFSLKGLRERRDLLLDPLERALEARPLRVSLLVRSRNNVAKHRGDAEALAGLGVSIHADSLNHAKAVIADERHGALFSANFDAEHGLLDGVEVGVRLDGQAALDEAVRYFDHAIANADLTFVSRPTQRDMNERLGAHWRSAWPFEAEMGVTAPRRTWEQFRAAAASPPVLYECDPDGQIRLYASAGEWTLGHREQDGNRRLEGGDAGPKGDAAQLLSSWWLARRDGKGKREAHIRRGFCPALVRRAPAD